MNKYYNPGKYAFITKGQIDRGMVLEIDYVKQHVKQGDKSTGTYFILVLDIGYMNAKPGTWAVHALNLKEIKPAIFDQIIKKSDGVPITESIRGSDFGRLQFARRPKQQYLSQIKTLLKTTARNTYRTFDYYKGIKTVKLYNFNFYPNAK